MAVQVGHESQNTEEVGTAELAAQNPTDSNGSCISLDFVAITKCQKQSFVKD